MSSSVAICAAACALSLSIYSTNARSTGLPLTTRLALSATSSAASRAKVTDPLSGMVYEARLLAERDITGRIVVIDLALSQAGVARETRNLLEPPGRWHGAQPFLFAADEFLNGTTNSTFGRVRIIPILRRKIYLSVEIINAEIAPCTAPCYGNSFESINVLVGITSMQATQDQAKRG